MVLDPVQNPDWKIAREAEQHMKSIDQLAEELGLKPEEIQPYGHYIAKIEERAVRQRLANKPSGKYIDVTAITPTPLGEGKSTTTIGLVEGLAKRGKRTSAAIRQPSGGPTMGMKGSAAGGGLAQCIPLTPYSLNFTGDIHAIGAAHNLAMTALTARMQHERNYDDAKLERLSHMPRLNIDPTRVTSGFVMDFCVQALRNVIIGIEGDGRRNDGFMMRSHFDITVASEVMSILSIAHDLKDLRQRLGKIILAYNRQGDPVTTNDLEVAGAMTAWLVEAIKPNLIQTIEGQPVLVHTGPFGNIALGQSSIISDLVATKLSDIHVTESGFAADMGFEKFWNIKCHHSGLVPDCGVIVATVRSLKSHGGAPVPKPGLPLPEEYLHENVGMVEQGCVNLLHHINTVRKAGIPAVVCINKFKTDSPEEIKAIRDLCERKGARVAVSEHWEKGGEGALELADCVLDALQAPKQFTPLYAWHEPIVDRITKIAKEVYGAEGVEFSPLALEKLQSFQKRPDANDLGICMVKTQYSLSDDPNKKGVPTGWNLRVRDAVCFGGAGLICPIAGDISLMPGTGSNPAFRRIDVNTETGEVTGLF
ncbi:MAG: formate--tetrahydrofolate ligase [Desulfovibrionaceae bacterium]|nr:formate--tetrahydrofolate ligase [Desulfovibrionaceae bacterium]